MRRKQCNAVISNSLGPNVVGMARAVRRSAGIHRRRCDLPCATEGSTTECCSASSVIGLRDFVLGVLATAGHGVETGAGGDEGAAVAGSLSQTLTRSGEVYTACVKGPRSSGCTRMCQNAGGVARKAEAARRAVEQTWFEEGTRGLWPRWFYSKLNRNKSNKTDW